MELLRIKLSLPVSVNALYASRPDGRWYMTEEARAWEAYAIYSIRDNRTCKDRAAIQAAHDHKEPLVLCLDAKMPVERILDRDSDNMIKLTQDAVTAALWPSEPSYDDRFVFDVHVTRRPTTTGEAAYLLVALSTLEIEELRHAVQSATRNPFSKVARTTQAAARRTRSSVQRIRRDIPSGNRQNPPTQNAPNRT